MQIEVEAVPVAGAEPTSGKTTRTAGSVAEAFGRAHDAITEVARSTAQVIEKAGPAEEASLKVTPGYDVAARPVAEPLEAAAALAGPLQEPLAGLS